MVDLSMFPKKFKLDETREIIVRGLEKSDEDELLRFMNELPPDERIYGRRKRHDAPADRRRLVQYGEISGT